MFGKHIDLGSSVYPEYRSGQRANAGIRHNHVVQKVLDDFRFVVGYVISLPKVFKVKKNSTYMVNKVAINVVWYLIMYRLNIFCIIYALWNIR